MNSADANSRSGIDQAEIRFLVEKNADGIIVIDENGTVLFANPAAEQIFGRQAELLIGRPIGIPFIAGDTAEIAIHKPDGDQIDAEIRIVDTTWDRQPVRLASLRDVSARKATEERLRHSAKMEAVGLLTAGIAHDFNNLLTVVLGNLESAQRRFSATDPALSRALENANRGARQAAKLTEKLLAFARRKPLEPQLLDVNRLVSGMSDLLQRTLGEQIVVRTGLIKDPWNVEIDPTELEAAILNLAVNARDAMPSGGQLVIETSNVELDSEHPTVNADIASGPYVLISVTDTGMGMTPDVLKQVFEPFFTTKAGGRGTGLGLSQVYGFVRQSGGHVKLYSEPGIGTSVKIYLPKVMDAAVPTWTPVAEPQAAADAPRAKQGETVLVVEDEADVRSYTVNSLRELGYRVFEAIDARSALEILTRENDICLLFTDLGLPGGMDGRVLAERARANRPSIQVLMTTAYAAGALVHEGRLDAEIELLNKPFTYAALATRIRELLDRQREQRETRILVVEDEFLVQMFLADVLVDAGCAVLGAASASEGLTKFRAEHGELAGAIIDLGLPDRRGDELVADIRAVQPDLPIILATGYADDSVRRRFAHDERLVFLSKPFDSESLLAALRRFGIRCS
ncbi:response regulator [Bradyrhizobium sp. AUGA SZCCT0240]|uniref:response regulator n=1 Tax=unclassified Bradyrhizobium TaxID=2631580 RepID=UPI001BA81FDA|nr:MULTISPECIES: response regulator [unclassified Bradyrhizobium]MBR1199685.1 response regulator [Bradyrhizobium sp. AUGA SZCCT0158]MBR1243902.1 response regulator [Bradyrhizobium sp. AUGA SZCCT0274]MBR1256976.1 response regulator [Bradyrhizobium sp. AUGA SZCCT0240]